MTKADPRVDLIAGAEGLCLLQSQQDAFGTDRHKPHYFIVAAEDAALTGAIREASHQAPPQDILKAVDAKEVFVIRSQRCAAETENFIFQLQGTGFVREPSWPTLPLLNTAKDHTSIIRLTKFASSSSSSNFERSYAAERQSLAIPEDDHGLLVLLQAEIESATSVAVRETGFEAKYGVIDVMNVGSSSRGTYTGFPADFDIVINTQRERTTMELDDARRVCARIIADVKQTDTFQRFKTAVAKRKCWAQADMENGIVLESFGARGPQSLVARYDLTVFDEPDPSRRVGFLDLTFGRLPQLIGYETWVRRLFERLEPTSAERLRSEIRLAKSLLKRVGNIYGTPVRGLRAHAVEQWIIQSLDFRASGFDIGTLSNALCLIVEEAGANAHLAEPASFNSYKTRFPLRHPGWWETEPEHSDRRRINLWDLLGDGEVAIAATKWQAFVDLAMTFKNLMDADSEWDVPSLAGAVRGA